MTRGTADVQVSPNELGLNPTDLIAIYRDMFTARAVSERLWLLGRQGKVYFLVSCEGHEAAQVGSVYGMRPGTDIFVPYYRDLAVALAVGSEPKDMVLHALGKAADPYSGGRQLPGHYSSKDGTSSADRAASPRRSSTVSGRHSPPSTEGKMRSPSPTSETAPPAKAISTRR